MSDSLLPHGLYVACQAPLSMRLPRQEYWSGFAISFSRGLKLGTYLPMRIYGLKIYESDVLVKNYLPFVKNGVAGLTNSLDVSDIKLSTTVGLTSPIAAVYDAGGDITDDDYEKEAYVEFPGVAGQGVNTGHIVTKDTCIEMDFSCWNTTSTGEPFFFEQLNSNGEIHARLFRRSSGYFSYRFEDLPSENWTNVRALDNERYQFKFDSPNGRLTIHRNGEELYNEAMPGPSWSTHTGGPRPCSPGRSLPPLRPPPWLSPCKTDNRWEFAA